MIKRILFYNSGGGIGDAIQILPLINSLKAEFKNSKLYYLCAHENHFNTNLKELNCQIETINLDIQYFGFRWWHLFSVKKKLKKYKIEKFDLIVDLQSKLRNTLILRMIPHNYFVSSCFDLMDITITFRSPIATPTVVDGDLFFRQGGDQLNGGRRGAVNCQP